MSRITIAAALLYSCSTASHLQSIESRFNALQLGELVPQSKIDTARAEVEACTGEPIDLAGWTVWYVDAADVLTSCSGDPAFECYTNSQACNYPVPPGRTAEECPCVCSGLTSFATKRIAVAPGAKALKHELLRAGYGLDDDGDSDLWRCQ